MDSVRQVMDIQLVRDVGAVYVFRITGDKGGTYFLDLKIGKGQAQFTKDVKWCPVCIERDILMKTWEHMDGIYVLCKFDEILF